VLNISFDDRDVKLIVTHKNGTNVNRSNTYELEDGYFAANAEDWLSKDVTMETGGTILFEFTVNGVINTSNSFYVKIDNVKKDEDFMQGDSIC